MEKKKEITVEKIIEAAVPIFMKKGYLGASMREIAANMGIKAGSLYYHIRSKEELLEKIHDVLIDELLTESKKIIANKEINSKLKFELFVKDLLRVMAELKPYATVFFRDYSFLSPYYFRKINKKRKKYQDFLRGILADGIKSGEFQNVDIKIVSLGIFGMFMWAHMWVDPKGSLTPTGLANIFCDTLLNGFNAPKNNQINQIKPNKNLC